MGVLLAVVGWLRWDGMQVFDQDVSADTARLTPELYRDGLESAFLTPRVFWTWMIEGIVHAALVMFLPFESWRRGDVVKDGTGVGLWDYGTLVFLCVILVATLRLTIEVY